MLRNIQLHKLHIVILNPIQRGLCWVSSIGGRVYPQTNTAETPKKAGSPPLASPEALAKGMRPPVSGGPASSHAAVHATLPLGAAVMCMPTFREQDGNHQLYFTASEDIWSLGTLA